MAEDPSFPAPGTTSSVGGKVLGREVLGGEEGTSSLSEVERGHDGVGRKSLKETERHRNVAPPTHQGAECIQPGFPGAEHRAD